jgi:hypothetical protein
VDYSLKYLGVIERFFQLVILVDDEKLGNNVVNGGGVLVVFITLTVPVASSVQLPQPHTTSTSLLLSSRATSTKLSADV